MDGFEGKMVAPSLGETFQKETFEALALQVPGGHFLIFWFSVMNFWCLSWRLKKREYN